MSKDEFDISEIDEFLDEMLQLAEEKMPQESKKFLRAEGNKLRKGTLKEAKLSVKKDSGNYFKGIKRGKVYKYKGDEMAIRVYGASPHSHLIENGHRLVSKDGKELGFVKGYRVFERAAKKFEDEFFDDCEDFIDDLLGKGLR